MAILLLNKNSLKKYHYNPFDHNSKNNNCGISPLITIPKTIIAENENHKQYCYIEIIQPFYLLFQAKRKSLEEPLNMS